MKLKIYLFMAAMALSVGASRLATAHDETATDVLESSSEGEGAWARLTPERLLEAIARSQEHNKLDLPSDTTTQDVHAAFQAIHAKLKPKAQRPSELETDAAFFQSLNADQKRGIAKLHEAYTKKVQNGSIKPVRRPDGTWDLEPGQGGLRGSGRGHSGWGPSEGTDDWHRVGDGWWRWSTSYSWWGVRVSLNHNFLYYLCSYSSWMLSNSGLPGWIRTVLSWLACAPHTLDRDASGATVYITYLGAFWYSP